MEGRGILSRSHSSEASGQGRPVARCIMFGTSLLNVHLFLSSMGTVMAAPSLVTGCDGVSHSEPPMPYFLAGRAEDCDVFKHREDAPVAGHTAEGEGLSKAETGHEASFTIRLGTEDGQLADGGWNTREGRFIYVWIAGENQIFNADVVNNGDGTLTATYTSDFPGNYLIHVDDVILSKKDEGMPIEGSPFSLTITGDPLLDVDDLPVCDTRDEDTASAFWKPGTWISSKIASAQHGVTRDGWVFQPKGCVFDTYSYEDLMLLASLDEPTWLVVLGSSVQRGLFLALVDMVLAIGQKDEFHSSALQRCWGYANVRVGNLRITYQDMRLYRFSAKEDSVICNNDKLVSGSSDAYIASSQRFVNSTLFQPDQPWPTVILSPSNLVDRDGGPNTGIEAIMEVLPKDWQGSLVMVDHMAGLNNHWREKNPTRTALADVGIEFHRIQPTANNGIERMDNYRQKDNRVVFESVFPMYQAKLFENQLSRNGARRYGGSIHYHYVMGADDGESYNGARVVRSSVIEMVANAMIGKAVGTKANLHQRAASKKDIGWQSSAVRRSFEVCTDCPADLLPFHVKSTPKAEWERVTSLPGDAPRGEVWDEEVCPDWCLQTAPVRQDPTESGMVDVRVCPTST